MKIPVRNVIHRFGEPVEFTPKDTGVTHFITASVQRPNPAELINDFEQDRFVVYIAHDDIPAAPKKFDRIRVRGTLCSVEDASQEVLDGVPLCYMLRVRG